MSRSLRQALALAVLAVHATFVVCGAGLHALPGLDHASRSTLGKPARATHSQGTSPASADDCPVCHFLAQGQVALDEPDGPAEAVETDRDIEASTPREPAPERLLTRLRAPPLPSSPSV